MVQFNYNDTISIHEVNMMKYKLIAREGIMWGIYRWRIKKLSGYAELYSEYSVAKSYNEVTNEMIDQIKTQYSSVRITKYECIIISDEGESNNG